MTRTERSRRSETERPADGPPHSAFAPHPAPLLRQLGLRPRKRWSQSFLIDPRIAEGIARAAELEPDDEVLEIGPGLGALTRHLCSAVRHVVAVEIDPKLVAGLPELLQAQNLTVVPEDALRFDPQPYFSGPYKLVANLPYHITSPILMRFLTEVSPPSLMVVTVQREVGERIAARPGAMSYLSVAVQVMANVELVRRIAPSAFYPRPEVESAVLRLRVLTEPRVPRSELVSFLRVALAGFAQPRKQLVNSLSQGLGWPREQVLAVLQEAGVVATRRPQELSLDEWLCLYLAVEAA